MGMFEHGSIEMSTLTYKISMMNPQSPRMDLEE